MCAVLAGGDLYAESGRPDTWRMPAIWTVERTAHRRLPFRIAIEQGGRLLFAVRAQSAWPGPGQQIFCLRERDVDAAEALEPVERVPVAHLARVGRKLTVVLDRPTRKRCEFLAIEKTAKRDGRRYEQVFFRTEAGIRAHRSRTRVELLPGTAVPLVVAVDSSERYPWRFPGGRLTRRRLAAGDYALLQDGRSVAVVERKTFDNLLSDVGAIQALHHQWQDLARFPHAAVVIEAQYGDFLDERRLAGRWPAAHLARVLAELSALHPGLPVVFAGNRKLANAWCVRFFTACAEAAAVPQLELVREAVARYEPAAPGAGVDARVRATALGRADAAFALAELAAALPEVPRPRIRRLLGELEAEGLLSRDGRGRGTRWIRAE